MRRTRCLSLLLALTALAPGGCGGPASRVEGACEPLEIEAARRERTALRSFGSVGEWEIFADDRLACSEVFLRDRVECELLQGGRVVLDAEGGILAFRNDAAPLVSVRISSEGVSCVERPEHRDAPR